MKPSRRRLDEAGIALLLVLVAVVLVAALATEVAQTARTQQRLGSHTMNDYLLRTAVDGRTQILRAALRFDLSMGDNVDTEDDVWAWSHRDELSGWGERDTAYGGPATEAATYRNTDVTLLAWCEDERSKLNLLGLSRAAGSDDFKHTRETLIRLIDEYREDWSDLDLSESEAEELVDDLVEFLSENGDEDEDPVPNVPTGRGKLQSVDDLLRVPGAKWTHEILYDVKDPDSEDEDGRPVEVDDSEGTDGNWQRSNGIPGLWRYLTVAAESQQNPPLQINYNTAPVVLLRALFAAGDADYADELVECRRMGAGTDDDDESAAAAPQEGGWLTGRESLSCVEGLPTSAEDLARAHPRFNHFFGTNSQIYSIRVIATSQTAVGEGFDADPDDDEAPRAKLASYEYRETVVRSTEGFRTLMSERRHDPVFDQ